MLELAAAAFLVLHGVIHLAYATPKREDPRYPFVPERTWFATAVHLPPAPARAAFATLAAATTAAYVLAAVGLVIDASWWGPAAVAGSALSLIELVLGFHVWLVLGVAIDVAIVYTVVSAHWPASLF